MVAKHEFYLLVALGIFGCCSAAHIEQNLVLNPPGAKSSDVYKRIFSEDAPVLSRAETLELLKEEAKNLAGSESVIDRTRRVFVNKFIEFADVRKENCDLEKNVRWYLDHIGEKALNILTYLHDIEDELYELCHDEPDVVPMSESDSPAYKKIFYPDAPVLKPEETLRLLKTEALRLSVGKLTKDDQAKRAIVETCLSLGQLSKEHCDSIEELDWLVSNVDAVRHPNIKVFLEHYLSEQKAKC